MSMSTDRKTQPRTRKPHAARRHGAAPDRANRRPDQRTHADVIAELEAIGWRVTEIRPSIGDSLALWRVTIERVDLVAKMTVTAPDPDVALEELARYAASDADGAPV